MAPRLSTRGRTLAVGAVAALAVFVATPAAVAGGSDQAADGEATFTAQVVGGVASAEGAHPFAAQVVVIRGSSAVLCGGSLVAPTWVLTAAHCIRGDNGQNVRPSTSRVYLGSNALLGGTSYGVVSFAVHPDFAGSNPLDSADDVALVQLDRPVTALAPIAMLDPTSAALAAPGTAVQVLGWGVTNSDGSGPPASTMQETGLTVVDPVALGYAAAPRELWARNPTSTPCFGDSGGPLFVTTAGVARLAGVVSGGSSCAVPVPANAAAIFARVSDKYTWVTSVISPSGGGSVPPAPTVSAPITPMAPVRLLDTRIGLGAPAGPVTAGSTVAIAVAGVSGVPNDATAALVNVTAVAARSDGYVTAFPCGSSPPEASNLNVTAGSTVAAMATVAVGPGGNVCLYSYGMTDLIADLDGYSSPSGGSTFEPLDPRRVLDTRVGVGATGPIAAGGVVRLDLVSSGIVPSGTTAVALNVTAVQTSAAGHVTVYPCGGPPPNASNLNYGTNQTVPNLAVVPLAADGSVCLSTYASVQLVADLTGYLGPVGRFQLAPMTPLRVLDSRRGQGSTRIPAGGTIVLDLRSRAGIDGAVHAVAVNLTAVNPGSGGYLTAYACDANRPATSSVNYAATQIVANQVMTAVSATGTLCIFSYAPTDVLADISGTFR